MVRSETGRLGKRSILAVALIVMILASFASVFAVRANAAETVNMDYIFSESKNRVFKVASYGSDYNGFWTMCVEPKIQIDPTDYVATLGPTAVGYPDGTGTGLTTRTASWTPAQVQKIAIAYDYMIRQGTAVSQVTSTGEGGYAAVLFDYWMKRMQDPNYGIKDGVDQLEASWSYRKIRDMSEQYYSEHKDDYVGHAQVLEHPDGAQAYAVFWVTPAAGDLTIEKTSSAPSITNNNSNYSLASAKYGLYKDQACTQKVKDLVTNAAGKAVEQDLPLGTYYLKEITAPKGYRLSTQVTKVTLEAGKNVTAKLTDAPQTASFNVTKAPTDATKVANNPNYSLAAAEYTLYKDQACTQKAGTMTTGGNGETNKIENLPLGTYYIKETKAPKGYRLDTTVHTITGKPDALATLSIKDAPMMAGISLVKIDAENTDAQGDATLEGIKFQIKNLDDGKVWKEITTGPDGKATTGAEDLPLGRYEVTEIAQNASMTDKGTLKLEVTLTGENDKQVVPLADEFENIVKKGEIKVQKNSLETGDAIAQGGGKLEGATIAIYNISKAPVKIGENTYPVSETEPMFTQETGPDGTTTFENLPYGTYKVKQTRH